MSTKGQTINDRLNAAKYTLAGQALARCICKATTEELMRPKKKHLDYLASCTYQANVSMQQLTSLLIDRTNHSNWAVVYKALITVHHLMSYGSERFTQYLASSNYSFQLNNFLDRIVAKGYAMSTFIRRYSNYINQKALSYRTLALDLCRCKRNPEGSVLRKMPIERLLETLPVTQKQLDALLDFGCTPDELNNSIITASFTLLFHDAIRLFASYNDGIINLFEKYFELNKKMCREAFECYKKFLACTDRVAEFLKVAEAINLNTGDIPDLRRAPSSLLDAFEKHLISLENNKKRDIKLEVDTKLAAFPSFSVNTSELDSPELGHDSPTLADMSKDFDAQLTFSTGDEEDFASSKAPSNSEPSPRPTIDNNPLASIDNFSSAFDAFPQVMKPSAEPVDSFQTQIIGISFPAAKSAPFAGAKSPFDENESPFDTATSTTVKNNLFDRNPPGFADGALLTPEALQITIDPSIDPQTQQQLIQIKREQVANRMNNNNSASINSGHHASSAGSGKANKPTKESMFEDLEKTMRQSLLKTEKA